MLLGWRGHGQLPPEHLHVHLHHAAAASWARCFWDSELVEKARLSTAYESSIYAQELSSQQEPAGGHHADLGLEADLAAVLQIVLRT